MESSRIVKPLRSMHIEVIRLAFQGWSLTRIAASLGYARGTVSPVLYSPLAQAELARMNAEAEALLVSVPLRVGRMREMERLSKEARRVRALEQLTP